MFEAYKVFVTLSLIDGVSKGLKEISIGFRKIDKEAQALNQKLKSISNFTMAGVAMSAAGGAGIFGLKTAVSAANEYTHQLALMNQMGIQHRDIVKATAAAWKAADIVPTSSAAENMATMRHLLMVFGASDMKDVTRYMPMVQQMQAVLSSTIGGRVGDVSYDVAKALEMRGATLNPALFQSQADMMTKAIVASGGKVTPGDFLSAFKYGRTASLGWNDQFTYTILPTLIQEMKARGGFGTGGPGNALMSAYAAVVGGVVPQKALKVWQNLGLLDPSKIVWTKAHEAKGLEPGGIKGWQQFMANPFDWAQSVLMPALKKAGYITPEDQRQAIQYLFPNRTAGFAMQQLVTQPWKFVRDQQLIQRATGLLGYAALLKTDPVLAQLALQKQWNNLLAILGYTIMPELLKGMQILISVFRNLTNLIRAHQLAFKVLIVFFGALSAVLAIAGSIAVLAAAFLSITLIGPELLVVSGIITGIGIVLVALGVAIRKFWDDVKQIYLTFKPYVAGNHASGATFYPSIAGMLNGMQNSPADSGAHKQPHQSSSGTQGVIYLDKHQVGKFIFGSPMDSFHYQNQLSSMGGFNVSMSPAVPGAPQPF